MNAFMKIYFDHFRGTAGSANRSLDYCMGLAGQRHNAAIMVAIHFPAEHQHARRAPYRLNNRLHDALIAAFGKIRNTFNHAVRS